MNRNINIKDLEFRQDYLSASGNTAISSTGTLFKIGDKVKHVGDKYNLTGIIHRFEVNTKTYDVIAVVVLNDDGWEVRGRISFLYHLENNRDE